uniref:Single-stranded DNA-binding protein, mitochondrial n=1 Tax=Aegilops tauschii subsp. strangulata TaxID=200361 RepID=A0A453FMH8_AEGTS
MSTKLLNSLSLRRLLGQQRNPIDLYTASRAWSSSTSFSGAHEKNGMGVEADGDLADSWKDADFRGVYRAIICGSVGQVPVQKKLRNGHTVTVFTVGTGGMFDQRRAGAENLPMPAQWHRIAVHNEQLGTYAVQKLVKNAAVYVEGDIETRAYNDNINNQVKIVPEICVRFDGKIHLVQSGGSDVSKSLEELSKCGLY